VRALPVQSDALERVRGRATNPAAVYLAGLAESGRRTQRIALEICAELLTGGKLTAESLPWEQLRYEQMVALRSTLAERYAWRTANRMLCAVRGVLKAAWSMQLLSAEDYHRARNIKPVSGSTLPAGRHVPGSELAALFADPRNSVGADRDLALLAIFANVGLRRTELVKLTLADFDADRYTLRILGKGNKERLGYIKNEARTAFDRWLWRRGTWEGALFCPVHRSGSIQRKHMTDAAVAQALARMQERGGTKAFTPHDLRRTFAGRLFDAGADTPAVQSLMGHSDPAVTVRYDRRGEAARERAAELLHLPYKGGTQ
jgi:integrase